jgi:hypothetical protein
MEYVAQPVVAGADERRHRRRRGLIALLLGLSVLTLGSGVFSLAVFTSTDTATGEFSTGTIVLEAVPATLFQVTGILPGDSGSATLSVENHGTGELRYAMTSSSTGGASGLAGQLNLAVDLGTCASPGANLYTGTLDGAFFGAAAQGPDTDDQVIASGGTQDLCFSWDLPLSTDTGFQDATTTATFTFLAEQTLHNP